MKNGIKHTHLSPESIDALHGVKMKLGVYEKEHKDSFLGGLLSGAGAGEVFDKCGADPTGRQDLYKTEVEYKSAVDTFNSCKKTVNKEATLQKTTNTATDLSSFATNIGLFGAKDQPTQPQGTGSYDFSAGQPEKKKILGMPVALFVGIVILFIIVVAYIALKKKK